MVRCITIILFKITVGETVMSLSMDAHIHVSVNKEIPVLIVDFSIW